jgi:outer membrane protein assembly factor BamA
VNRLLLIALTLAGLPAADAQHVLLLHPDQALPEDFPTAHSLRNPGELRAVERAIVLDLQRQGFLENAIDSITVHGDSVHAVLHLGPRYRWARLNPGGIDRAIASEVRFRERYFNGKPLDPVQFARLTEEMLDHCENHGFPFASLTLDSILQTEEGLHARIVLDKGPLTRVDSVVVRGTAKIDPRYLQGRIGIAPGDPYNERLVAEVDQRLREIPFVIRKQRPFVLFSPGQTKLYLFLDHRNASNVNGILGILPDPETGRVNFTGDLDLRLRNAFKRGEAIDLNWRSLKDRTQDLKVRLDMPYLFRTPFGADLSLKLFKRDTTFLEVTMRAALTYLFGRNDRLSAFVSDRSSDRLGRQDIPAPGLADVDLTSYGLAFEHEHFDYRFNPRSGMAIAVDGSAGRKRSVEGVITGGEIPPETASDQYEWGGRAVGHVRIGDRGTLRLAGQGEGMVNDRLYANERFRVGGIKSLRGVDEASVLATSYCIGTVELRYILEENSNAFIFVDQAWWEDVTGEQLVTDTPLGFGAGTSFETKAGIFMLSYALGRQFGNPIDLRNSKVHFGFSSLF